MSRLKATRSTGIRLDPVADGVTRTPDERGVTSAPFWFTPGGRTPANRDSLATDLARGTQKTRIITVKDPVTGRVTTHHNPGDDRSPRTATIVDGVAYDFTTDMFGNEVNKRVVRTESMGDAPLPRVAFRRPRKTAAPKSARTTSTGRGTVVTRTPRDTTDIDAIIRATGYTGPITSQMRKLSRDVSSHRDSLAAYTAR